MKFDFVFQNPTKIYFGKTSLNHLEEELNNYGKNILLAYGGGSIKKNGIYDKVIEALKKCNKNIIECSGILLKAGFGKIPLHSIIFLLHFFKASITLS